MLELLAVLVLRALRVRIFWARINGRLRVKAISIEWSGRKRRSSRQ
jgi:hypothetical protein